MDIVLETDRLGKRYGSKWALRDCSLRLPAVRAHLLDMAGELEAAVKQYQAAASRTTSMPEKHYLTIQAARLKAKLDASDVDNPTPGPSTD